MKGTGTKFKANLIAGQPVGDKLTEDQMKMIGISKRMSESNYMNFSPKVRAMYEEQISGVTPTGKVQGITKDKTFVQENQSLKLHLSFHHYLLLMQVVWAVLQVLILDLVVLEALHLSQFHLIILVISTLYSLQFSIIAQHTFEVR